MRLFEIRKGFLPQHLRSHTIRIDRTDTYYPEKQTIESFSDSEGGNMENRKVALEAGKVLEEVFDVAGRQVVPDIVVAADDLVVRIAEINQSARDFFEWVI